MKCFFTREKHFWILMLCMLVSGAAMAQKTISGKITDKKSNSPMPGVSILEKGTRNGTKTADNGSFTLTLQTANPVIVISFVGYTGQELRVNNRSTIDIVMDENITGLNDAVVIGYQNTTRRQTSAAIASIKGKDIENTPYPTFDAMLQGRIAGLNILSVSAEPGASGIVNIRGNSSVANNSGTGTATGVSAPLYVIDGVVFDVSDLRTAYGNSNPLAAINPNDIESIDVLKDASAAAIYGARAANGVIIVNTKRPKGGKPQFRLSSYVGLSTSPKMKQVTIGAEERRLKMDILKRATYAQQQSMSQFLTDSLNPAFNNATDFQDLLFQDGLVRNIDFNVAGLTESMSYRISLNNYDEKGIQPGYRIQRTTPRLYLSIKPTKTVEFTTDLYFGFIKEQRGDGTGNAAPFSIQGFPSSFWQMDDVTRMTFSGKNDKVRDDNRTTSINGNTRMIWKITPSITFTSSLSFNFGFARRDYLKDRSVLNSNNRSDASLFESNSRRWELENYATWNKSFGPDKIHSLSVLVGQGAEEQMINSTDASANGIPFDAIRIISGVPNGPNLTVSTNFEERSRVSYFTRASYQFKGRYAIDASFRRDASSRYANSSRWGTFPAVSGRWTISDEPFFEKIKKHVSFLKIRASYGITGRDPGSYYAQYRQLTTGASFPTGSVGGAQGGIVTYNGLTTVVPNYNGAAPAPNITWEKAPQTNLGIDMNFLRDRISVSLDFYNKEGKDLIFLVPVPVTTGYTTAQNNFVDIVNQGVELSLNTNNLSDRSKLKWQTGINIAYNRNFVTKLPDNNRDFTYGPSFRSRILTVGQPLYQFRVFDITGVYASTADVPVDPLTGRRMTLYSGAGFVAGDPIKRDLNGDYNVDDNDVINYGDPNTKFYGGVTNNFTYKGFSLQILTTFIAGRKVWNGYLSDELAGAGQVGNYGTVAGPAADIADFNFWTRAGQNAQWGNLLSTADATTIRSSIFVEDVSFFRLKNIYLSYTIPASGFTRRLGIRQIRVYSVADNIAVFYNANLPDPEMIQADGNYGGTGNGSYPLPKKFTFGVDIQF
jgi:TonB-dependent starch-binding outer membrane protein SusC